MSSKPNNLKQFLIYGILGVILGGTLVMYLQSGTTFLQNRVIVFGLVATVFGLIMLFRKNR